MDTSTTTQLSKESLQRSEVSTLDGLSLKEASPPKKIFKCFVMMLLVLSVSKAYSLPSEEQKTPESIQLSNFITEYLNDYWETHPEEATRNGIHTHNKELIDLSATNQQERLLRLRQFLTDLEAISPQGLNPDELVDKSLLRSHIRVLDIAISRHMQWRHDPGLYIPFSALNTLISKNFAPLEKRGAQLLGRLKKIPKLLLQGRQNLITPPRIFTQTAIRTTKRVLPFYQNNIPDFAAKIPDLEDSILASNQTAIEALQNFLTYLEEELLPHSGGSIAIGRELYDFYLKEFHLLDDDADSLLAKGERYYKETELLLQQAALEIDPEKDWMEITEELRDHHPSREGLLDSYCEEIQRARDHVQKQALVTIPSGEKVECVYTPPSQRAFSPFGTFSSPPPFSKEKKGYLILHPIDPNLSDRQAEAMLRAHDPTWISVIAPHESYPGHHLQALKAQENPRLIRKVYRSPLFSEGWGLYCEELMYETGFFKQRKQTRLTQLRTRLWRAARVILDVKLHIGQITYDEARKFLVDNIKFEPNSTAGEVNIYAFRPSYAISYIVGYYELMDLRQEYSREKGDSFSLLEYHDRLLTQGSMPFRLVRQLLLDN
jgi:uncharacterized protein (DUF885 family)